jgi:hypothetical protein
MTTMEERGKEAAVSLPAVVGRVNDTGLAYVHTGQRTYVFSFDKIENYKGETADELGLRQGTSVLLKVLGPHVTSVHLLEMSTK